MTQSNGFEEDELEVPYFDAEVPFQFSISEVSKSPKSIPYVCTLHQPGAFDAYQNLNSTHFGTPFCAHPFARPFPAKAALRQARLARTARSDSTERGRPLGATGNELLDVSREIVFTMSSLFTLIFSYLS